MLDVKFFNYPSLHVGYDAHRNEDKSCLLLSYIQKSFEIIQNRPCGDDRWAGTFLIILSAG